MRKLQHVVTYIWFDDATKDCVEISQGQMDQINRLTDKYLFNKGVDQ
jgi:hypothetical protein